MKLSTSGVTGTKIMTFVVSCKVKLGMLSAKHGVPQEGISAIQSEQAMLLLYRHVKDTLQTTDVVNQHHGTRYHE